MADIRAFKGVRPVPHMAKQVASKPYDVIKTKEAQAIIQANPFSFLKVVRSEVDLPNCTDPYDQSVYLQAKLNFDNLLEQDILFQDSTPCLYLYRQTMAGKIQTGIVATAAVDDYLSNVIKKHEHTRQAKEQDRINHVTVCQANTGPVFLTYRKHDALAQIIASWIAQHDPVYDYITSEDVGHIFWVIDDTMVINSIVTHFKSIDSLYVADGHHRSAAAAKVGQLKRQEAPTPDPTANYQAFLSVLFPDDELTILPYNRVLCDLNQKTPATILSEIGENFQVEKLEKTTIFQPSARHQFGLYLDQQWYCLTANPNIINENDPIEALDVYLLQTFVLAPVFGIADPRTDQRIDFVGGIRGPQELVRMCHEEGMKAAISMFPTSIHELLTVADAGQIMPPKSTWFEPKLQSGLISHIIK